MQVIRSSNTYDVVKRLAAKAGLLILLLTFSISMIVQAAAAPSNQPGEPSKEGRKRAAPAPTSG